ncbi:MAG TPA: Na/Pi cotransporter family protein, partial [Clostridia bacterium]|nr:Na/Pi cotransporter family protein [Clostridia bacterium]
IANAHTLFNMINTCLFLPFVNQFVNLVVKIVPGREEVLVRGPLYLDDRMLKTPAIALSLATKEIVRMANLAHQMVLEAMEAFLRRDEHKVQWVYEQEEIIDQLAEQITTYLVQISQTEMTPALSKKHTSLLHSVTDIERIGDHAENIAEMAMVRIQENLPFSDQALEEISSMSSLVSETYLQAIHSLQHDNVDEAKKTLELEKQIDILEKELRRNHIHRLNTGKCFPGSGVIYLDIMSNLERIGDHSNNISSAVLGEH